MTLIEAWRQRRHQDRRRWITLGIAALLVAATGAYAASAGHTGLPLAVTLVAFFLLLAPYALLVGSSFDKDLKVWLRGNPRGLVEVVGAIQVIYLVYALATGCFDWWAWARLFGFVAVPTALVFLRRRRPEPGWLDLLAIAALWLPFDTGFLKSIWAWPAGEGAYILNTALAVSLVLILFKGWRGFDVRIRFQLSMHELRVALGALLAFIAFGVPFGLLTGFLEIAPKTELFRWIATPIGILFFVALPEELLFRGLVQNVLTMWWGRPIRALVVASVFFGLTHLNNGPAPDWRYVFLATLAGLAYGTTYMRTRSLLAPAIVHCLVDTLWVLLLHAPT